MINARLLTRVAIVGAGAMLLANTAMAGAPTVKGCQAALEKTIKGMQAAVAKGLQGCTDTVQKSVDKGVTLTAAKEGAACDKKFDKLDLAEGKILTKCLTKLKCDANTLHLLGHGVSGPGPGGNAPGNAAGVVDWVCNYVIERAESLGISQVYNSNPLASAQIAAAAALNPAGSTAEFFNTEPEEATHACVLTASSASVVTGLGTIPLGIPGILQLNVFVDEDNPDWVLLTGGVSKSIPPVSLLGNNVCIATTQAEGACDCSAASPNWNKNIILCRDSDTADGDECVAQTASLDNSTGTTANGPLWADYGVVATGTGDCNGVLAVSFKIVAPANVGTDGVPCTPDDTAAPLPAAAVPFTTGTTTGTILDANNVDGAVLTATRTGAPISSCTALRASTLTGLKFASAPPTMDGNLTGDAILAIVLQCS